MEIEQWKYGHFSGIISNIYLHFLCHTPLIKLNISYKNTFTYNIMKARHYFLYFLHILTVKICKVDLCMILLCPAPGNPVPDAVFGPHSLFPLSGSSVSESQQQMDSYINSYGHSMPPYKHVKSICFPIWHASLSFHG